jgi:hypothetical protein
VSESTAKYLAIGIAAFLGSIVLGSAIWLVLQ